MKNILFLLLLLIGNLSASSQSVILYDFGGHEADVMSTRACFPSTTSVTCNTPFTFNLVGGGYVGSNPTSGDAGCNPCCYAGSDLDCDGLQDVSFSVENSVWFTWCNPTGAPLSVTVGFDEPGGGSSCNIQGAVWVGSTLSSTVMDCGNSQYFQYGSNPGGAADGFTFTVTVGVGECAYFMVDGYAGSTCNGVSAIVPCPVGLPIELIEFGGFNKGPINHLFWTTASETNNSYFSIERSNNGYDWELAGNVSGAGNSSNYLNYEFLDNDFSQELNYYRLIQTDYDGKNEVFKTITIDNSKDSGIKIVKMINFMGHDVSDDYEGIKIIYYSDGTIIKKVGK